MLGAGAFIFPPTDISTAGAGHNYRERKKSHPDGRLVDRLDKRHAMSAIAVKVRPEAPFYLTKKSPSSLHCYRFGFKPSLAAVTRAGKGKISKG